MNFKLLTSALLLALRLFVSQTVEDPESLLTGDEPFTVNSGMMMTQITGTGYIVQLSDGVEIIHGSAVITGDSGFADQEKGMVKVLGNVRVRDGEVLITSSSAVYYRDSRIAEAYGDAKLINQGQEISAQRLRYDRNKKMSSAFENVIMFDPRNNTFLYGDTGHYYLEEDYGILTGYCRMLSLSDGDSFSVDGDTMENFADSGYYVVSGNVTVTRGAVRAETQKLFYYPEEEKVVVFGRLPWISNESSKIWGDSIVMWLDGNELVRIESWRNAGGTFTENDVENQIYGNFINLYFLRNKPRLLEVIGNVIGSRNTERNDEDE
ncbi:hypothetical protein JW890_05575 [candidate division WOR-3 bacterium]|nr:hypothetical protein [candidate division WOR-3 bacterium]